VCVAYKRVWRANRRFCHRGESDSESLGRCGVGISGQRYQWLAFHVLSSSVRVSCVCVVQTRSAAKCVGDFSRRKNSVVVGSLVLASKQCIMVCNLVCLRIVARRWVSRKYSSLFAFSSESSAISRHFDSVSVLHHHISVCECVVLCGVRDTH